MACWDAGGAGALLHSSAEEVLVGLEVRLGVEVEQGMECESIGK